MRLFILAFATGVLILQTQPELPDWRFWALLGGLMVLPGWRWRGWPARLLTVAACCALGFAWAGWRADHRLAEHLPVAWEGRDIEVVGVIAGLPQDFNNGTRFEFAVEKTLTAAAIVPQRLQLSWYQGRRDGEAFERRSIRPGERWRFTVRLKRPHGNANPGGFDYSVEPMSKRKQYDLRAVKKSLAIKAGM